MRYARGYPAALLAQINATGYGSTMGLHTRIDETIARVVDAAHAGNVYVNRNMVGAVVGVQPFGGEGLSGTGPKAGGPLYLYRLLAARPDDVLVRALRSHETASPAADRSATLLQVLERWAGSQGHAALVWGRVRRRPMYARQPDADIARADRRAQRLFDRAAQQGPVPG